MEENINNAIKEAIENAPERKFVESMDIQFTIKDVDLKNPTNRIKEEVRLPSGRGREVRIAMFAAGEAATRAREAGIHVITPPEIEELGEFLGGLIGCHFHALDEAERASLVAKVFLWLYHGVPILGPVICVIVFYC